MKIKGLGDIWTVVKRFTINIDRVVSNLILINDKGKKIGITRKGLKHFNLIK